MKVLVAFSSCLTRTPGTATRLGGGVCDRNGVSSARHSGRASRHSGRASLGIALALLTLAFGVSVGGRALAQEALAEDAAVPAAVPAAGTLPRIDERYASEVEGETPDFQRHVVPLLGTLGCNGRACHGSFQGQGGFRLSLFGYDFAADHAAMLDPEQPRIDRDEPLNSLVFTKPASDLDHEGGKRFEPESWQAHVLRAWLVGGAERTEDVWQPGALSIPE